MEPWWEPTTGRQLAQGDLLPNCVVPIMPPDFAPPPLGELGGPFRFSAQIYDLIVLTQSCDLENDKAPLVAACPISSLSAFEQTNPDFARGGRWEQARQGRIEGLHLLASIDDPAANTQALVADFRQIYSLPIGYLTAHAGGLGPRHRLRPPYLEHFSQAFARFFMRVGLPSDIPRFR
jgi:hypothetical protein